MNQHGANCKKCGERPAEAGALVWFLHLPYLLIGGPFFPDAYCKDCAGGMNFLGLLGTVFLLVIAFVLIVLKLS